MGTPTYTKYTKSTECVCKGVEGIHRVPANTYTRAREERVSDLLCQTFAGTVVHWQNGPRSGGSRPDWLDWPMHTAADIAPRWVPPSKRRA